MPERTGIEFEFEFAQPQTQPAYRATGEGPMRILLMGDFSGRSNRGVLGHGDDLAARPTVPVDVDNLDDVLTGYAPRLHLPPHPPLLSLHLPRPQPLPPPSPTPARPLSKSVAG